MKTDIIPSNFEYRNSTLLVEELPRAKNANGKIDKLLRKKYPYNYQFAQSEDILNSSGTYRDSVKYRYAIISNIGQNTTLNQNGTWKSYKVVDYHIYDRLVKKHYPATGYSASFAKMPFETLLNTLLIAIKERK